jgi:hypothetical protein
MTEPHSSTQKKKKLLDQPTLPDECEHRDLYEESLWRLYALQDYVLQKGNSFMEKDRHEKIATCTYFTRSVLTIWLTCFCGRWGNRDQADKVASCAVSRADAG